jgi:hypothetical protein
MFLLLIKLLSLAVESSLVITPLAPLTPHTSLMATTQLFLLVHQLVEEISLYTRWKPFMT